MQSVGEVLFMALAHIGDEVPHDPEDYIGGDGLLACGKCHTPKQCEVQMGVTKIRPPIACECTRAAFAERDRLKAENDAMNAMDRIKRASLMSDRMLEYTLDKFVRRRENDRLYKLIRRYIDGFDEMHRRNQGLLFYGPVGSGKTYAAACIANELMARRIPVLATSMIRIMQNDKFGDGDAELIEYANRAKLLIMDDIGAERATDFAIERVFGVVDARSRAGKPLIITTNLTLSQMQGATDMRYARIYSRILETCYPVEISGISWRTESAAERYDNMRTLLEGLE